MDNNQLSSSIGTKSIPSSSTQVSLANTNVSSNNSSTDNSTSQSGKRKLSLEQYKHKRLKSAETTENYAADVDMRINNPNENVKVNRILSIDKNQLSFSQNSPPSPSAVLENIPSQPSEIRQGNSRRSFLSLLTWLFFAFLSRCHFKK